MDVSLRNNIRSLECAGQILNRMEEKRIFDLILVKFGRFLVNYGNILVKSGFFLVFFGIDVLSLPLISGFVAFSGRRPFRALSSI